MKRKFEQQTCVIDRSIWRCGAGLENVHGVGPTQLLNSDGYMCCLGQFSCQLGVPKEDLLYQYSPRDLRIEWDIPFLLTKTKFDNERNSILAHDAIGINDNPDFTSAQRERALKKLFVNHGIKLTFKGTYNDDGK